MLPLSIHSENSIPLYKIEKDPAAGPFSVMDCNSGADYSMIIL